MSLYSCFDGVIGLTRQEDDCVEGYDSSYSDSESGLYIDELQGMALRILNSTGGNATIWQKMENARENAINAFKVDALKEILKTKEPARKNFIGTIGGKSFSSLLASDTYYGLRMFSDIRGGTFTLRGVTLILSTTEAVNLNVYTGETEEDGAAAIHTFALTSSAGRQKYNAVTPTQLSLEGDLYFLYSSTGTPYNNKLNCNCGGYKWCFDLLNPCFRQSRDRWTEWAMVGGVHGSDLTIRDDWGTSRDAEGLILHGDFGCDTMGILCGDESDFASNEIDSAIAWAILYKTGSFLSSYIMDSQEVNRYTLLGVDGLGANIAYYEDRYKMMLEYIAENIEDDRNECLKCRSPHGYARKAQML